MQRQIAIGDVHGCLNALTTLVKALGLTREDEVIFLGDYVDRGPDSRGVIDFVLELRENFAVTCLRGNHEIMMEGASLNHERIHDWLVVGGLETLESYGGGINEIPVRHHEFLREVLEDYTETETHIFVHAGLDPDRPMAEQCEDAVFWRRFHGIMPHLSGKIAVCGHTPQLSGFPLDFGYAVCIDTGAYAGGWLTALDVLSGDLWQANQHGELRTGNLKHVTQLGVPGHAGAKGHAPGCHQPAH